MIVVVCGKKRFGTPKILNPEMGSGKDVGREGPGRDISVSGVS